MSDAKRIKLIRRAIANYVRSEGCDCCRGTGHDRHFKALIKVLGIGKEGFRPYSSTNFQYNKRSS